MSCFLSTFIHRLLSHSPSSSEADRLEPNKHNRHKMLSVVSVEKRDGRTQVASGCWRVSEGLTKGSGAPVADHNYTDERWQEHNDCSVTAKVKCCFLSDLLKVKHLHVVDEARSSKVTGCCSNPSIFSPFLLRFSYITILFQSESWRSIWSTV